MAKKNQAPLILLPHFFMADDSESVRDNKIKEQDKIFQKFLVEYYDIDNSDQVFYHKFISFSSSYEPSIEPGELLAQACQFKDTIVFSDYQINIFESFIKKTIELSRSTVNTILLIDNNGKLVTGYIKGIVDKNLNT